jgi:thiamine biosynthesis lipoprotein
MGCAAEVEVIGGDASHLELARRRLAHLEHRWSRFIADSDISRLNAAQGAPVSIDPSTVVLLDAMVHGHHATDGAFDPTVLATVVRLGYAASRHDPALRVDVPAGTARRGDVTGIEVVRDDRVVDGAAIGINVARLPAGTALDAGGIGKGLAADLVVHELLSAGAHGAMVSVGGDLRVGGHGPNDGDWVIAVHDDDGIVDHVCLHDGGVATSGTVHHQVDPAQGDAAIVTDRSARLVQATVVGGSAMWAEVCATWVMVRGIEALDHLERLSLGVRLQFADGTLRTTQSWHRFALAPAADPMASTTQVLEGTN